MAESTRPDGADSPAILLAPTALGLGIAAAAGLFPWLTLGLTPVMLVAGALAFTFGLTGIHYALRGIGRLWMAATGAVLGALGFIWPVVLFTGYLWPGPRLL
ncbi:hypothetical protein AB0L59_32620 [Streptomyces sp. NPDC052109]|uniref:hypothetical protein n=1 Tax=Streptomyces sp. NPDC052109 TaxID=3155527 RepID=UPI003419E3C1